MTTDTSKGTVLMLVGPDYEDLEVWYPKLRLEEAGYVVKLAGLGDTHYTGKWGYPLKADGHVKDYPADSLVGLIAPGGWAPDKLRRDDEVKRRVREVHAQGKLIGTICHGGWILISAGIVKGKKITGTTAIKDDLENAGAIWQDEAVVIDGNIVSSRVPKDLPQFGKALVDVLARQHLERGLEIEGSAPRRNLSSIAGTWVEDPEIDDALAAQRRVDPDLWR